MKITDIRAMSVDQMKEALVNLKKEQFNLRFQKASGQIKSTARIGGVRVDIARIKTLLHQLRDKNVKA